jgi:hypothetical protein
VSAGFEDAHTLCEAARQIDMVKDIAAPDHVERSVGPRQRLDPGQLGAHPICEPGLGDFLRARAM